MEEFCGLPSLFGRKSQETPLYKGIRRDEGRRKTLICTFTRTFTRTLTRCLIGVIATNYEKAKKDAKNEVVD
jgi:hypothetical protein